jgi:signal transduction histidine kinase
MARAQERELREWLYADRPTPGTSLAAELRDLVAQVEDGRIGSSAASVDIDIVAVDLVAIDLVTVGDAAPTEGTTALLQAAREALLNAVAHGKAPVSVYLEVTAAAADLFVRDRGAGFDVDAIAPDRFGVRESILGRVRRRGGTAEVVSRPDWGTEVRLHMPLDGERPALPDADRPGTVRPAISASCAPSGE